MRYASIRKMDISNGEGIGIALFTQGCHFHCDSCCNQETWDFSGGNEWTPEVEEEFLKLIDRPYISRISLLGGDPLANENVHGVLSLVQKIRKRYPDKKIWIYSGFTWNQVFYPVVTDDLNLQRDKILENRRDIIRLCDVYVDGRFEKDKKDLTLKFRGSSNQRVVDVQKSLRNREIILWDNN